MKEEESDDEVELNENPMLQNKDDTERKEYEIAHSVALSNQEKLRKEKMELENAQDNLAEYVKRLKASQQRHELEAKTPTRKARRVGRKKAEMQPQQVHG